MSKRKINLEEIIKPYRKYLVEGIEGYKNISGNGMFVGDVLAAMKEACKQALELAAENALVESIFDDNGEINEVLESMYKPHPHNKRLDENIHVNKQSILYTINQVE